MTILVLALGLMVWPVEVSQAEPMGTAFTYQGLLYDANEVANGLYDFLFRVFRSAQGDVGILDVNKPEVEVIECDLSVIDGSFIGEPDFGSSVFDGNSVWLEIGVRPGDSNDYNDFVILSPRQEVTPTPYALQTRGIFVDEAGNVGIGTSNPQGLLHVDTDPNDPCNQGILLVGVFPAEFEGASIISTDQGGGMSTGGNQDLFLMSGTGKVGIGTTEPAYELDVLGDIHASGGFIAGSTTTYEDGYISMSAGTDLDIDSGTLFIDNADNQVGIGTETPLNKLHVVGGRVEIDEDQTNSRWEIHGTAAAFAIKDLDEGPYRLWINNGTEGHVGIGTIAPEFRLTVDDDGGIIAKGAYGSGADLTTSGAGTRLIWYPKKAAFRAGRTFASEWDNANIGAYSVAMGYRGTASATYSTVCGGFNGGATADKATVCGGASNTASAEESFVGGGFSNTASGGRAFIAGGAQNVASGASAFIGGGGTNQASGNGSVALGGTYNVAGAHYSFASGRRAKANHQGTFVWADSTDADFASSSTDQFLIRASSGVGINVTNPSEDLDVLGTARLRGISVAGDPNLYPVVADENGKLWKTAISSRRYKTNIEDLETETDTVLQLRPVRFQWKTTGNRDIGLIAEEVEASAKELVIYDKEGRPDGVRYDKVALYLLDVVKAQQDKITALEQRLEALEKTTQQPFGLAKEVQ